MATLQALNHMGGSTVIYAGDTLIVPGTRSTSPAVRRPASTVVMRTYTVRSGDGLIVVSFDERDRDLEVVTSRCRVGASWFGDPLRDLEAAYRELGKLS